MVKSGKKGNIFVGMNTALLGEFDCKADAKGRFMFPSDLKKQMEDRFDQGFVLNRNLHQKCLVLYPLAEWEKINQRLAQLNRLIKTNDIFIRRFSGGATPVSADPAGRILLPKPLTDYAAIQNELKVIGSNNVIELWDKTTYDAFMTQEMDLEQLALQVLGQDQDMHKA